MKERQQLVVGSFLLVGLILNSGFSSGFFLQVAGVFGLVEHDTPGPGPVPSNGTFTDVTTAAHLAFRHSAWNPTRVPYPAIIGGGVGIADFDGDTWEDLYVTNGIQQGPAGEREPGRLYRNLGDGTFEDATARSGITRTGWGTGVAWGDFDRDGHVDLFLAFYDRNTLYRNRGDGTFEDVTDSAGVSGEGRCPGVPCLPSSVGWFDYDLDGRLDLYVVNNLKNDPARIDSLSASDVSTALLFGEGQPNLLFHNNGDGTFTERAKAAGVADQTGKGLGLILGDLDGDGWHDIYTANDVSDDALFLNDRDGTFREVSGDVGIVEFKSNMGASVGDVTNGGRRHIATTNLKGTNLACCGTSLYKDNGDGSYRYATAEMGLSGTLAGTGWGVDFTDFDLDGDLDMFQAVGTFVDPADDDDVTNLFFRNEGGTFVETTGQLGDYADSWITRAAAAFDFDHDGDEDLVFANTQGGPLILLRNDAGVKGGHRSVSIELRATSHHWEALGASVVMVRGDGLQLRRDVITARSFQTSASPILSFGLGTQEDASFRIAWPGGTVQNVTLDGGHRYRVTEGNPTPERLF